MKRCFGCAETQRKRAQGESTPLTYPPGCARSVRVGLKLLGRLLRRSRDVWRFRLRNDAVQAARQTRRFDAVETLLRCYPLVRQGRLTL